jgi:hypothetical protein
MAMRGRRRGARRSEHGDGQPKQSGRRPAKGEREGERVTQDKLATVFVQDVDSELRQESYKDFSNKHLHIS